MPANMGMIFTALKKIKDLTERVSQLETTFQNTRDGYDARVTQLEEHVQILLDSVPSSTKVKIQRFYKEKKT